MASGANAQWLVSGTKEHVILDTYPETSVSCDVAATAEQLWPLISDITMPARFSDELREAEWLGPANEPSVGSSFIGRNASSRGYVWETNPTVTTFERPTTFQWTVGDLDAPVAIWSFEVTDGAAGTVLTHRVRLGPGRSPVRGAIEADPSSERQVVERRLGDLGASMRKVIEGIKALAESGK